MNGLSNADYAVWLNNDAAAEYESIDAVYVRNTSGQDNTFQNKEIIKSYLEGATEQIVSGLAYVKFSGGSGSSSWVAVDDRVTTNIERTTTDNSFVPVGVKRPVGA